MYYDPAMQDEIPKMQRFSVSKNSGSVKKNLQRRDSSKGPSETEKKYRERLDETQKSTKVFSQVASVQEGDSQIEDADDDMKSVDSFKQEPKVKGGRAPLRTKSKMVSKNKWDAEEELEKKDQMINERFGEPELNIQKGLQVRKEQTYVNLRQKTAQTQFKASQYRADKNLTKVEKKKAVSAVACGFPVSWSSCYNSEHTNPRMTGNESEVAAWSAKKNDDNQWIQVCFVIPRTVVAVDIAGRPDEYNQFVKAFKIFYTMDGVDWIDYNEYDDFEGNTNTESVIRHDLDEFEALSVRIVPTEWNKHISMRFDVHFK